MYVCIRICYSKFGADQFSDYLGPLLWVLTKAAMSSGHASEDEFASAESEAEDSGEGGSLDEQQVVEGMGVGLDEGVGCDEGEGTGSDDPGREPKERNDREEMQGADPTPQLVHDSAKEGACPTQEVQVDGSEGGTGGKVKEGFDGERVSEEVHVKESVEAKQEEAGQSSTAAKDEQHEVAPSKQLQDDLPEQEMDRRVEVHVACLWYRTAL